MSLNVVLPPTLTPYGQAYSQLVPSPSPVADVVARMEALVAPLSTSDGIACFTRLYLAVTEGVQECLAGPDFQDPRFLERLDVAFADLFFAATDAFQHDPAQTPRAWLPLFEARSRRGIAPLQFALAGMNAHINRDLPVALVTTCEELGLELRADSPQHSDYVRVNGVLELVEARVKAAYLPASLGFLARILHRFDRVDDVVAMWNVRRARDAAWTNAATLWALRGQERLQTEFIETLDRMVGFAGRGMLVPADTVLGRLARRFGRRPAV